jgi:hypothetical protein
VSRPYRGRGFGFARLWAAALPVLARAGDRRVVGLDGVLAQHEIYCPSGFIIAHRNVRYRGPVPDTQSHSAISLLSCPETPVVSLVELSDVDVVALPTLIEGVVTYDADVFSARRAPFVSSWLFTEGHVAFAAQQSDKIVGYAVSRPTRGAATQLGPLFADNLQMAKQLLRAMLQPRPWQHGLPRCAWQQYSGVPDGSGGPLTVMLRNFETRAGHLWKGSANCDAQDLRGYFGLSGRGAGNVCAVEDARAGYLADLGRQRVQRRHGRGPESGLAKLQGPCRRHRVAEPRPLRLRGPAVLDSGRREEAGVVGSGVLVFWDPHAERGLRQRPTGVEPLLYRRARVSRPYSKVTQDQGEGHTLPMHRGRCRRPEFRRLLDEAVEVEPFPS